VIEVPAPSRATKTVHEENLVFEEPEADEWVMMFLLLALTVLTAQALGH
jgi:hypothetical protein